MQKILEWFYGNASRPPEGWVRYFLYKLLFTVYALSPSALRSKLERRALLAAPASDWVVGFVPLSYLRLGHPVRWHWWDRKLLARYKKLAAEPLASRLPISRQLGSISPIKVAECGLNYYIVVDGNGRVAAYQRRVLTQPSPTACHIEVWIYSPRKEIS